MDQSIFENVYFKEAMQTMSLLKKLFHQQCLELTDDVHITKEQGILLHMIDEGTLTQSQIAKHLHISKATLSVRIKRLEEAGYIKRQITSGDHRKYALSITKQGEEECQKVAKAMDHLVRKMIRSLSIDDYNEIMQILHTMIHNLQEEE